jgi:hypothetical protein
MVFLDMNYNICDGCKVPHDHAESRCCEGCDVMEDLCERCVRVVSIPATADQGLQRKIYCNNCYMIFKEKTKNNTQVR